MNTSNKNLTHYVRAAAGTYVVDGEVKTNWSPIGKVFTDGEGNMSMLLESIPTSHDFAGHCILAPRNPSRSKPNRGYAHKYGKHAKPEVDVSRPVVKPPSDDKEVPF